MGMRAGFVLPGGSAGEQIEHAVAAEAAGWDAVFVWEGAYHVDAWCLLAAIAERTTRIRIGTMLTPLPWRLPWEVATQPVQQPRIPIWVVGAWKKGRSMRRAARYDGVLPQIIDHGEDGFGATYQEMAAWVREHPHPDGRTADVIWESETPADNEAEAIAKVTRWRDRGATWWLESRWAPDRTDVRARIDAGPPRPAST